MTTSKSIVLKYNMKKLLTNLIPFIAKIVNKKIKKKKITCYKKDIV